MNSVFLSNEIVLKCLGLVKNYKKLQGFKHPLTPPTYTPQIITRVGVSHGPSMSIDGYTTDHKDIMTHDSFFFLTNDTYDS